MYDFWQDNYEWLLSGIIPTLITAIFGIIKYRKTKGTRTYLKKRISKLILFMPITIQVI